MGTNQEMQDRILGGFSKLVRNLDKKEKSFDELPLGERIKIMEKLEDEQRETLAKEKTASSANKITIKDTYWSRGSERREIKMLEQRGLLL